ncbi:MAG: hypothetical protein IT561_17430 [Alphaproteobacteria bacterium]|nr:hypothetical protein [Alphaproteobacteria bacterium]
MAFGPGRLAALGIVLTVLVLGADKLGLLWERPRPPAPPAAAVPVPVPAPATVAAPPPAAAATGYVRDSADVPENLPEGGHREEIFWFCTACHSSELIRRQGMSRDRWDEVLTVMTDRHGMPPLEGTERDKYLDYLATALPPRRRGYENPFLRRQ